MRHVKIILALLVSVSIIALAGRYVTPEAAAMDCPKVRQVLSHGFAVQTIETEQVLYKMAPTGVYLWGRVTMTAHGNDPATTYAGYKVIECEIRANDNGQGISYQVISTNIRDVPYF